MSLQQQKYKPEMAREVLPDKPGVYIFYGDQGTAIYVGKAKNLKKRVASYFNKNLTGKTAVLVKKIAWIEHIVVETESDALLLENNLIKTHQPRYNILLKDDKSFPWICIKNEPFPRVFLTRNPVKDGSEYFGPYTSAYMVRILLDLIRKLYPLRTCKYLLTDKNIRSGKFRPCLEYHIGNCLGPCIGKQTSEQYDRSLKGVRQILKGNISEVVTQLKQEMAEYAIDFQYEKAQYIKEKLQILEKYQSKTVIVNRSMKDTDVFSYIEKDNRIVVHYLKVDKGAVIQSHTVEAKRILEESREDIFLQIIGQIRERLHSTANMSIVPFNPGTEIPGNKWIVPVRGDKRKLLELSGRNARLYLIEREKNSKNAVKKDEEYKRLEMLRDDLRLKKTPIHMECFDNSNLQGTNAVSACIVFRYGRPSKKDYRHYHVRTVEGPDDFATMKEIIFRRYSRLIREKASLPQLIVIDGGKGQLSAASSVLKELGIEKKTGIIGIAKRLEEIYFPNDPVPLYLDKTGSSLKLIQYMRDEAHRFGISFHRHIRRKNTVRSLLDDIPGIGEATVNKIIRHFKSVKRLQEATPEEIEMLIGKAKTKIILENLGSGTKR